MRKYISYISTVLIIVSCQTQQSDKGAVPVQDALEVQDVDSNARLEKEERMPEVPSFEYFEDYAKIKSKLELYQTFDSTQLKDEILWYAEGTVKVEVTYLINPQNKHVIKYCWQKKNNDQLDFIEANYFQFDEKGELSSGSSIESRTGLRLGMPIDELETWNGNDFKFMGFSWDYEGVILTESDDKLSEIPIDVKLSLDYNYPTETSSNLMGDIEFISSDSAVKKAIIVIDRFTFNL
ncbi:MAG: hypothetical protein AB8B72_04660 [Crocinitomicaceae bacterium]